MDNKEINYLREINLGEKKNKADVLLKRLQYLIVSQKLPADFMFPNENEMCEMLSIGRGTLREVYKVLELDFYITRSKSGTYVNDIMTIAEKGSFDNSLIISENENIVEFLSIIEPEAAKLAAERADDEEINEIYDTMLKLENYNHQKNYEKAHEYNALFHQLIRGACHNPIIINSINTCRRYYEENIIRQLIFDDKDSIDFMNLCLMQHYSLYYAIRTRNAIKAHEIMHEHFMADWDYFKRISAK